MKPGYIMFLVGLVPSMILELFYYFIREPDYLVLF
jgi:hypothetical protein